MRNARSAVLFIIVAALTMLGSVEARAASLEELVAAVVRIKTTINPDGQTVQSLGREREGGVLVDGAEEREDDCVRPLWIARIDVRVASPASATRSTSTVNSSPPNRATVSAARTVRARRSPIATSS